MTVSLTAKTFTRVASICLVALTAACSDCARSKAEPTTLERIRRDKVVRIGYANEAPYAYRQGGTGRVTGEAPEIARVVFKQLGAESVEGVLTEFGSLIPGLKAGRFDVIAAGMYVRPERCKQIDFSRPTYSIGEGLAVKRGNPKKLNSYADIATGDATIGVVAGAVERAYARASGIPDDRIIVFPDAPSAVEGVRAGRVDAYAGTALTVQDMVDKEQTGDIERARPFSDPIVDGEPVRGYGAFGFRKGDDELREAVNRLLEEFIGTPQHAALVRPFGFTETELPLGVGVDELCGNSAGTSQQ